MRSSLIFLLVATAIGFVTAAPANSEARATLPVVDLGYALHRATMNVRRISSRTTLSLLNDFRKVPSNVNSQLVALTTSQTYDMAHHQQPI